MMVISDCFEYFLFANVWYRVVWAIEWHFIPYVVLGVC